jgi:hypothetical protein
MNRSLLFVILLLCTFTYILNATENYASEKSNTTSKAPTNNADTPKKITENVSSSSNKAISDIGRPIYTHHAENGEKKQDESPDQSWWHKLKSDPVATFTFLLFIATVLLWWSTRQLVLGAERSSTQELRAYLSVSIGGGSYQDRFKGIKFEVRPLLINSGHTPAHNVTYWAKAAILPLPLSDNFQFPSIENIIKSSYVLGPNQSLILNAMVDDYVPDEEVENIKLGKDKSPYIWGSVSYTDVFGVSHTTNFCHCLTWNGPAENPIVGYYDKRYNDAT